MPAPRTVAHWSCSTRCADVYPCPCQCRMLAARHRLAELGFTVDKCNVKPALHAPAPCARSPLLSSRMLHAPLNSESPFSRPIRLSPPPSFLCICPSTLHVAASDTYTQRIHTCSRQYDLFYH
jgi:hypothetical protein